MAFVLAATWLAIAPPSAGAQDMSSPLPPRARVGAGIGLASLNDDPFPELDGCTGRPSGTASAALDIGVRLSRWLHVEVSAAKHLPFGAPVGCPSLPLLPRTTGPDTLSRATSYPRRDRSSVEVRLAVPATWRYASARIFAGVGHLEPTRRTGTVVGGALSAGGLVRARVEIEQWLLPAARNVEDVFFMDGREVGRRERVERVLARPSFIRLGIQIGR